MSQIKTLSEVVTSRLCIGCGACSYICPEQKVELWDFLSEGIRPVVDQTECNCCRQCLDVCPVVHTDFGTFDKANATHDIDSALSAAAFKEDWGQVLEVWEGYATDPDIRFKGSSGGVLTALSAYCLEARGMHGILHVGQHPTDPIRNSTRLSRTRAELVTATGSRYSPASVCDSLHLVEHSPTPCVIIGKPGEIAAVSKAIRLRPPLEEKVGLTLSFFCAETPATAGTVALLKTLGMKSETLKDLRYRGFGWPGFFAPVRRGESTPAGKIPYQESWKFLQSFRPWSVHLWPDGTGEMADISCGDPWYEKPDGANPGFSLVAVRSERGRLIVQAAIEAGYVTLSRAEPWKLVKSQQPLANKKASTWGRILAMRLFALPVPHFENAHLFACWLRQPLNDKIRSVVGTARRIISRKLYRPQSLDPTTAVLVRRNESFGHSEKRMPHIAEDL